MIVVDTNVMVYFLTGAGLGEDAALLFKKDPEWAAPPILMSELRNVLIGLLRKGDLQDHDAVSICDDAEAVLGERMAHVPSDVVLQNAIDSKVSAYDAEFITLARRLRVPLVTEDRAILKGASDVAVGLKAVGEKLRERERDQG
jgi:predicted nucleic acid-binding protein